MRRRFSADKALHFNKKKKSNKNILHLSMLATEARNNIDENQQLSETFDILENLVKKTKSILCKLTSKKNISKTEIMDNLKEEKNGHVILNKSLKGERNFTRLKYNKSKNELNKNVTNLENELDILINRKFIYENALIEKQLIIQKGKVKLKDLKLIGEDEKEVHVSCNESKKIFNTVIEIYQVILIKQFKLFNKIQNKCCKLLDTKKILLDEIYHLKYDSKNSKIIFFDNDDSIQKTDEDESILNESISSNIEEDYMNFPLNQINLEKSSIDKNKILNKNKISKLLLEQIRYNNERNKPEDAEKSLSRILEKNKDSKDIKIKKLKENIKRLKKRIKQKEIKCKEYEEKIENIKKYIQKNNLINNQCQ